jgi:AcrR family transcriptional regulator
VTSVASDHEAPRRDTLAGSRQRLLETAATLLYREGVGVGVERLCRAAGVSKRSMYQLFGTKDELIAESLRLTGERTTERYVTPDDRDRTPRDQIMRVFRRLEEETSSLDFAGCPFVSTAVELKDHEHEAVAIAVAFKGRLSAFFAERVAEAGVGGDDGREAAEALTAVFDGCAIRAVMRNGPLDGLSLRMAGTVLDSYGIAA